VGPDHIATIVYTSGTTGPPKGVQHSHGVLMFHVGAMQRLAPVSSHGRVVSYLPMAHIAERYVSHYCGLAFGYTITCCSNPKRLPETIVSTRPTRFFGVPRIYEKLTAAALSIVKADQTGVLPNAVEAGTARVRAEQSGQKAPALSDEHELALAGLRERLGLDQAEWTGVAAAPTPYAVLEFLHAIGVPVAELWGMSECALSTSNPPGAVKLGTVGTPVPGVEIKLADDGEILVRGRGIMKGYRKDPERTREAIDEEGWLHSGDIAVSDDDGYLKIVDRKKELIINSAGKNMSPTHIEGMITQESSLIGQVVAIGDARQYVTALIVLDPDAAAALAAAEGIDCDVPILIEHDRVRAEVDAAVGRGNANLARVEQVKAYRLLPTIWEPGGDEITPTMKLKRKPIMAKYATEIESLYAG
jgi:long-subunit acyl-CoA synthetase (AMP-forming)